MTDKAKIYGAFVKAQKEFAPALKSSSNPHFKSKYADLAACVEAVIDALNNHGIAMIQRTHDDESGVTVETVFIHESGECLEGGRLHVPAAKQDPQGYGSALTYCRRYSLMAACGIAPEDDDGNAASQPRKPVASPAPQQAQAQSKQVGPEPDAEILAQLNSATTVPALTQVMNALPAEQKRLYTGHFNARMGELKKAA
jgi:hypothetical protein